MNIFLPSNCGDFFIGSKCRLHRLDPPTPAGSVPWSAMTGTSPESVHHAWQARSPPEGILWIEDGMRGRGRKLLTHDHTMSPYREKQRHLWCSDANLDVVHCTDNLPIIQHRIMQSERILRYNFKEKDIYILGLQVSSGETTSSNTIATVVILKLPPQLF
ncbi:uncharacterized protein BO80DRAFT_177240 [Aspergillus ibericus CBS 121593]|uniref:Uncharacterized protein n=1 Tax=Aspergillus ibericus CBS 121593 TaxID=1448316 RepID=A0A395HBU8_9EURO|nr:hypothetical protein BO80DRAFT_177240 [Aspergillus ibericus CBS 121593]RAL05106.1 hypothetical protein BO80DRAFT_177240 [Aspergillus ibericus CBS 121593]